VDDDEYLNELMAKMETYSVVEYSWHECVEGFKQADIDMGSAFHRKLEWMNKAADIYLSENNKMAGFVGKFADDCGIGPDYGSRLNRIRKTFPLCKAENFSHDTLDVLLSAPEELREEIVSSGNPVTVSEIKEAKAEYKAIQEEPEYSDLFEQVQQKEITPRQAIEQKKARTVEDFRVRENQEEVKLGLDDVVTPMFTVVSTWYREFDNIVTPEQLADEAWKRLSRNPDLRSVEQMAEELVRLKQFQQVYAEMINNLDKIIEQAQPKLKLVASN
jgi:hypothetical protein